MTLTRLVLAWIPTAGWFVIATLAIAPLVAFVARRSGEPASPGVTAFSLIKWRVVEAAVLTLFASLWFDSLGSGGWWLVFLLVGVLASIPTWLRPSADGMPRNALFVGACADLARYVFGGAILAWRLG